MMKNLLLLALSLLCIALLFYPSRDPQPDDQQTSYGAFPTRSLNQLGQRVEALEADLNTALMARQQLELRIQQLELAAGSSNELETTSIEPTEAATASSSEQVIVDQVQSIEPEDIRRRMIAAGLNTSLVDRIQQTVDQNRLERLQWRDQAIREGWQESVEFSERMNQLSDPLSGIREEFGDPVYDQYLFSSGQPNRVQVRSVLRGSAAELAGIQPGDILISYANQRIFDMQALRQATTEGIAGEPVLVEMQRDGLPTALTLPRGPMGITMESTRQAPQ